MGNRVAMASVEKHVSSSGWGSLHQAGTKSLGIKSIVWMIATSKRIYVCKLWIISWLTYWHVLSWKDFLINSLKNSFHANKLIKLNVGMLVSKFYPQLHFNIIFTDEFFIWNILHFKDKISPCVKSNIVYKYSCGLCPGTHTGESTRHYQTCVSEHRGISPQTSMHYSKPPKNNIYSHHLETGHDIDSGNFGIIFSGLEWETKLAESIY